MECMKAWEYIEFFFKYGSEANIAHLRWIYSNMLVSLFSLLLSQYLSIL